MSDEQVTETQHKHVPGESNAKEQLRELASQVNGSGSRETYSGPREIKSSVKAREETDPVAKAKQVVVDNYNDHRDASRMPALTPELVTLIWFNGTRTNWKADLECQIVSGVRYEVSFNSRRNGANLLVYRKINNLRINFDA